MASSHPSAHEPALLLSDAGLPALVAAAILAEEAASSHDSSAKPGAIWAYPAHPEFSKPLGIACEQAAARQAEALGLEFLGRAAVGSAGAAARFGIAGQSETTLLVMAAYAAAKAGFRRVIWPIQACNPHDPQGSQIDLDAAARAIDRALLVGRLATLDLDPTLETHAVPEVRIETPMVDLTDVQIADLARDLAAPVSTCWWWGGKTLDVPLAEAAWARWSKRLGVSTELDQSTRSESLTEPKPTGSIAASSPA